MNVLESILSWMSLFFQSHKGRRCAKRLLRYWLFSLFLCVLFSCWSQPSLFLERLLQKSYLCMYILTNRVRTYEDIELSFDRALENLQKSMYAYVSLEISNFLWIVYARKSKYLYVRTDQQIAGNSELHMLSSREF